MLKNTICQLYMYHTIAICLFYKTLQVLKYTTYNVLEKDHFKINQVLKCVHAILSILKYCL